MAQQLKEEVRARMLASAEAVFADAGYRGATMASIATRANVSAGNLYRYFANKDELFYSLVTDELAETFFRILRRRVNALVESPDMRKLGVDAQHEADELLRFWIDHRQKVIVLLDRAEGSRFETFRERFVDQLLKPTRRALRDQTGKRRLSPVAEFTLRNVFDNTVRTIVSILEEDDDEARIRGAFDAFWSYQLAGLAGLKEWVKRC